ncbi:MAG TPA: hypothetical protein VFE47_17065 [Tepidisphaeraceae bacterium]|jgi:hypothetical protein|nr:hypothetical protein [Tepidisphaeraceae bacterium]
MHAGMRFIFHCAALLVALTAAGCAHEIALPGGAVMVSSGQGILRFVPEDNGSVYLMDAASKHPIYAQHIFRGDTVLIDPAQDRIEIRGQVNDHKQKLNCDHVYRIYFDRDS